MAIKYLSDQFVISAVGEDSNHRESGRDVDGYGQKISTPYCVLLGKKWRRVYATCFSNAASHWVIVDKQTYHLRDYDVDRTKLVKLDGTTPIE